jgi:endonuclease-3
MRSTICQAAAEVNGAGGGAAQRVRIAPMKPKDIDEFFARLAKERPDPRSELRFINPYTLLVAVVLSAQATDAGVNKATEPLFQRVDTPEKMLALGEEALREAIKTIGLFNTKAKNVMALSRLLVERHGGAVPRDRDALEALPGVGRKTANVVLNVAFGEPTIAVDTHIFRVANRTGLAPGKTPLLVEEALERVVPERWKLHAHHWLILHGRYVCQARKPLCTTCIVADLCAYPAKTTATLAPVAKTAKAKPKSKRKAKRKR